MSFDVMGALVDGAERTFARNGLMFIAAYFLINLTGTFMGQQAAVDAMNVGAVDPATAGMVAVLSIVLTLLSIWVSIAAIRTFVSDETDTVPDEFVQRNIGHAMLHMIVGGIVFGILLAVGFMLLIIPGIYLLISLFFWSIYVVTEDMSFVEGMQRSWGLVEGHRWSLLAVGIALFGINLVISAVISQVGTATVPMMAVTQLLSAVGGTYVLATQGRVFDRLA